MSGPNPVLIRRNDFRSRHPTRRHGMGIMATGSLSLDDASKRFRMLEVRCGHCTRSGRLRIDKLIDEHGREMSLPDLRAFLAADCEHKSAAGLAYQCQVFYPQLRKLKRDGAP